MRTDSTMPAATGRAFQYALVIFALTATIGLVNATKIIGTVDRDTLLTHLHSGTLGWITMGVFGLAIWLFRANGETVNRNVFISALCTAAYVLSFWSGSFLPDLHFQLRAIFGTIMLAVIVGWWWWVVSKALAIGYGRLTIPQLSIALGLTTLVIGSTMGVIVQILFATNNLNDQNGVLIGAHAAAQVVGYLVLVAAGLIEWQLNPAGGRSVAGVIQSWLLFVAGVSISIGFLANVQPLLLVSNVFQLIGVGLVVFRLGSRVLSASWAAASGTRHAAIAVPFMILALGLTVALVVQFVTAGNDPAKQPGPGLFTALSHSYFVGLLTNVLFGALLGSAVNPQRVWPWADNVIFWGLNIGAASFIVVLLTVGSSAGAGPFSHPVAFTAPIMGLSALLGIVTFSMRLASAPSVVTAPALA